MLTQFKTLSDLMIAFQDPQTAIDHFTAIRWPKGAVCPYCDCPKAYALSRKNRFRCSGCTRNFSATIGTIFEDTKLPLRVWFGAIWLITNHPKRITATTLARDLKINLKSASLVLRRLRHADLPVAKEDDAEDGLDILDGDHTGPLASFDPEPLDDQYEAALFDLINQKRGGNPIAPAAKPPARGRPDLIDGLRKSIAVSRPNKMDADTPCVPTIGSRT